MAQEVKLAGNEYETVAASQTGQALGTTGKAGDVLQKLVIVPATLAAGSVTLIDNATSISVFVSGTLADLTPIVLDLNMASVSGAWSVTTGANVSVIAVGQFS